MNHSIFVNFEVSLTKTIHLNNFSGTIKTIYPQIFARYELNT